MGDSAVVHALPAVQLELLGVPHLLTPQGERLALERRDAALLAWLALEGETPRARLLELLWPDAEPGAARNILRQRLFQLRKRCRHDLVNGVEVISLAPALKVDLHAGADACGLLLDGCNYADCLNFADWLAAQRVRLANARRDALVSRAESDEKEGRLGAALGIALQLVALDPLHEHAHRRLMRLHYLRGDRAAALAAFERCERVLKDELSTQPGAETLALLKTIESSVALAGASRHAPVPAQILRPPRLVGRERELGLLRAAWSGARAFWLSGEAGLGKTRLIGEFVGEACAAEVLVVAARPGDAGVPYASLGRALRALVERRPPLLERAERGELARVMPELDVPMATRCRGRRASAS